ncbi:hypothetical protein J6590_003932 [Homalodisca vitripennis]|nr:hypothetical protein J6590_003932 [Homalodisca vitripennis]
MPRYLIDAHTETSLQIRYRVVGGRHSPGGRSISTSSWRGLLTATAPATADHAGEIKVKDT